MGKRLILASLMACMCLGVQAQNAKVEEPKGKAIVQVFGNFNSGFGTENDVRGFELERSYLGYEYNLGNGLFVKSVMDIGKSSDVSDNQRLAYVKNAMITWKKDNFTFNGGLITNIQFNFQEKFWGYRYVMRNFQDMYKFGNSADLGISASYKFNDFISADAIIVNGEGYKKLQKKDGLNYGVGVTLTLIKGLSVRLYGSVNEAADKSLENTSNFAAFVGYKGDGFSIGAEYNAMKNASFADGAHQHGYSVFSTLKLSGRTDLFGRFDDACSADDWNIAKDEQVAVLGAQFKLGKYVNLAPNLRMSMPKASGADNTYAGYVSFYFGL